MKITMLGTGEAMTTECYNTCFLLDDDGKYFMVDGGGGNTILRQIRHAGYNWMDIREIFVTHRHMDHLMGILWMIRATGQSMNQGKYEGEVNIYSHDDVIELLRSLSKQLLLPKLVRFIDERIHLVTVTDGETRKIHGWNVTFFDTCSTKEKQFGFCMELEHGGKLTCCGDEPYHPCEKQYVENSRWLLHEAFCLYSEADIFAPYEKHHSTVKDACEAAEKLGVQNLVLYHMEDRDMQNRKKRYREEGERYFHGKLYIPDDLDSILL